MDDITKKHFIHLSLIAVFFSLLTIIGISLNVYFTVIVLVFLMILFLLWFYYGRYTIVKPYFFCLKPLVYIAFYVF